MKKINIIGAGLAGCEAAWQAAKRGVAVTLYDMKPNKFSPAHHNANPAELVCSNSLRSDDDEQNAVGLMHYEMRKAGSLILEAADATKVPAGGALAVDRDGFCEYVAKKIDSCPLIERKSEEFTSLPDEKFGRTIVATGPLTSEKLASSVLDAIGNQALNFYDAIAPVVFKDSIDFSKAWYQSRYDKGDKFDYINCPMTEEQYNNFVSEILAAQKVEFHNFEEEKAAYFDGCLPIEVMAQRGAQTLRFGPMKPVGLTNPHSEEKPYAVVQLRQDNKEDTLRNIVGFQTKMKHPEQLRIFRMIPGLENAQFARLGGIHKNTFIQSPVVLDDFLQLKNAPHISFAGQITGCEGYVESACIGWLCGYFAACEMLEKTPIIPPKTTAFGAMLAHLRDDTDIKNYQPMNINFGLFENLEPKISAKGKKIWLKGSDRKTEYCKRAKQDFEIWLEKCK